MLMIVVSSVFAFVFAALSALHVYWAVGGQAGLGNAVPSIADKPAFQPGALLTMVVAGVLLGCAYVALWLGFSHRIAMPYADLAPYAGWGLAAMFAVRAIGDFRLVGFFKRVKGSPFAKFDSTLYSPLCVALSAGFVYLSAVAKV